MKKSTRAEAKKIRAEMKARMDRIEAGLVAEIAAVNAVLRSGVELRIPVREGSLMSGKVVDHVLNCHDGIWVYMKNHGGCFALANDGRWDEIVKLADLQRDARTKRDYATLRDVDAGEYEISDMVVPDCSMCGGPQMILGALGNRTHYRCRNCGMDNSADGTKSAIK